MVVGCYSPQRRVLATSYYLYPYGAVDSRLPVATGSPLPLPLTLCPVIPLTLGWWVRAVDLAYLAFPQPRPLPSLPCAVRWFGNPLTYALQRFPFPFLLILVAWHWWSLIRFVRWMVTLR